MRILMAGTGKTGRAGTANYEHTVGNRVDLEKYAGTLTFTQRQLLKAKHGRYARVWGMNDHKYISDELEPATRCGSTTTATSTTWRRS
jgi:hypothetical protein